jgi:ankyrin repeat protein
MMQSLKYHLAALVLGCAGCTAHAGSYEDFRDAAIADNVVVIQKLIKQGFDPNTAYDNGNRALHLAAFEGAIKVADLLVKLREVDVDQANASGETPLMIAALRNQKALFEALLARKAEVNKPGWTALHYAASTGQTDLVAALLERYAYIDAESPNKTTPVMMAARGGFDDAALLLAREGADLSLKNEQGMTAADFARKYKYDRLAVQLDKIAQANKAAAGGTPASPIVQTPAAPTAAATKPAGQVSAAKDVAPSGKVSPAAASTTAASKVAAKPAEAKAGAPSTSSSAADKPWMR